MTDSDKEAKKEDKKAEIKSDQNIKKFFKKKENIWLMVSIVLALALILSFIFPLGASKSKTGQSVVEFAKSRGVDAELVGVESQGDFYEVTLAMQGQEVPILVTKNGKYMVQGVLELSPKDSSITGAAVVDNPAEVPKSDRPVVDLYVFSYCPYGTQTEKGFIPVYNLLKNKADMDLVYIGAMHGEYEETESLRQLCVKKLYGKDKFMSYIMKFDTNASVGRCGSNEACSKPIADSIMKSLGINVANIDSCMAKDAPALYATDEEKAASLGISGSPTLVINGVQVQTGRSPAAILKTICSAFNTAPAECSQTLDSATPSAGFGASASETASAAQCG